MTSPSVPPDTSLEEMATIIDRVHSKQKEWAELPPAKKRDLFAACLERAKAEVENIIAAGCADRGYDVNDPKQQHLVADVIIGAWGVVPCWLVGAIKLMDSLARTGKPGKAIAETPSGDVTRLDVFPHDCFDRVAGDTGCAMTVPCGKGGKFTLIARGPAKQYDPLAAAPKVTGVLGPGNSYIINDIICPMVLENSVVVYKCNPVMARGCAVKKRIFKPLIDAGYLGWAYGGIDQGKFLTESPKIDGLGITGSVVTYDKIMWGNQDKQDQAAEPLYKKPFLAELGSVNPVIICPGKWSARDCAKKAHDIISTKMVNSCHICAAPQVILTSKGWPQRDEFVEALRQEIKKTPAYRMFYPNISKAYNKHKDAMGGDVTVQEDDGGFDVDGRLIFRSGVSPDADALQTQDEAFAPILIEVPIDGGNDFDSFMPKVIEFAQEKIWGTLTATFIIDDTTKNGNQEKLDKMLDEMRFGTIGVNVPPVLANFFPILTWGGFPGHTARDVQSGIGTFGNFHCYENVEKTVMQGRFNNLLQLTNGGSGAWLRKRSRRLTDVFAYNSWWRITKFAVAHFVGI